MTPYETDVVALLSDFLKERGHDPETVLGLPASTTAHTGLLQWQSLLQRSERACPLPAFGVQLAEHLQLKHLGIVGYLLMSSANALDALQRAQRYQLLFAGLNPMQLSVEGDQLVMSWPLLNGWGGQLQDELGLALVVQLCRMVLGIRGSLTQVDFVGPKPDQTAIYEQFFACPVQFEQPIPRLIAPLHQVFLPVVGTDAQLCASLDAQAEQRLQQLMPLVHELQTLRQQLLQLIRDGKPRISALAALSGVHVRAMQRSLAAHGTSFQQLLEETRGHLAEQYLADARLTLADIADLLAYADQTAFTRAFRSWRGCAPGVWRQQHGQRRVRQ